MFIKNRQEMKNLAKNIATIATKGDIIGLEGSLGMGKSFFAKAFINFLSNKEIIVPSPTFNIVYSYQIENYNIYHFDLYRIKNVAELDNICIKDYLDDGISLIEWPKIARDFFGKTYLEIIIQAGKTAEERIIKFNADKYWLTKLSKLTPVAFKK